MKNIEAIYKLSYGVYVIGTLDGERPTGCIANSAMQITSSPATIAVSINKNNYTNSCIMKSGRFSISVLAEDVDPSVIGTFGFSSGRDKNKFDETGSRELNGLPIVWQAAAGISLKVINSGSSWSIFWVKPRIVLCHLSCSSTPPEISFISSSPISCAK